VGLDDHEGTIRDIANNSGTVVDHRKYDSFGKMTSESAPTTDFIFGYTGQALDKATGLYDYWHRWYDPAAGRFATEDPSGFAAGDQNLYRYVGNNPLNNTDPSGLCGSSNYAFGNGLSYGSSYVADLYGGWGSVGDSYTSVTHTDSWGATYYENFRNGQPDGFTDELGNSVYFKYDKFGDFSTRQYGVNYTSVGAEPSSGAIWGGLFTTMFGGSVLGALADWSPAVATTLKVGGAASTLTSGYITEEYSRAAYYSYQAGDTLGVLENSTNAGLWGLGTGLGAYGTARSFFSSTEVTANNIFEGSTFRNVTDVGMDLTTAPGVVRPGTLAVDTGFYPAVSGIGVVDTGVYPAVVAPATAPAPRSPGYWWSGRYATPASQPGAYVNSGGLVFPTRRNSGLEGDALRGAQEAFTRVRLLEGQPVGVVRGQAREAGLA